MVTKIVDVYLSKSRDRTSNVPLVLNMKNTILVHNVIVFMTIILPQLILLQMQTKLNCGQDLTKLNQMEKRWSMNLIS